MDVREGALELEAAVAYAARHGLEALVTLRGDTIVDERYANGGAADEPHALYSGTKSFWGVLALAAQADGLLSLEETVGETFPEWRKGPKKGVTLRHLLTLTAGIGFGGLGNAVPTFDAALEVRLANEPGEKFAYNGTSLQVFGAVLRRKLEAREQSPQAFLHERILDPIGAHVATWRRLRDGTSPLSTGAFMTAREWLKYGRFVRDRGRWLGQQLVPAEAFDDAFHGTAANPQYGLAWWLSPFAKAPDVVYASGARGQALYIIPSADAAIARFGALGSHKHEPFLKRLLGLR